MNGADDELVLGFSRYQWLVIFAAWLGWGFDVFDALLFNYVSRLCIPSLLGPGHESPQEIARWTGIITSVLLFGWAVGGIAFGKITDRIGRARALLFTMLTYAIATAACAFAPNIWVLIGFRFVASLGIGGEWAAGAALVAETVPQVKRVAAGALLYTAAPAGLFLATLVTDLFTRQLASIASNPELSWRAVFLTGLIPAAAAFIVRLKVREPREWKPSERAHIRELFSPELRARTLGGIAMAFIALVTWWSCNSFVPLLASLLATEAAQGAPSLAALKASFVSIATTSFNLGGLLGTLLTIPIATRLGRRPMFVLYFALSALSIGYTLLLPHAPVWRLYSFFFVGLSVFGIFGSFTFYLPELFPMHLRATGAGFCYNFGRLLTVGGPFLVGYFARHAASSETILRVVGSVALIPLIGVVLTVLGVGAETRSTTH